MFDVIGVGICIACISYLCCVYTTTLMSRSRNNSRRQKRCKASTPPKKSAECSGEKYSKSTRRRCPCAEARQQQQNFSVPITRRRICLVASSFFDVESTEGSDGKCKRPDSERACTGETKYLLCH